MTGPTTLPHDTRDDEILAARKTILSLNAEIVLLHEQLHAKHRENRELAEKLLHRNRSSG